MSTGAQSSVSPPQTVCVAVIGVGLVGSEFIAQLQHFPAPSPFRLVALASSKHLLIAPDGVPPSADWAAALRGSATTHDYAFLTRELAALVTPGRRVVLVDSTASADVAGRYPVWLRLGIDVVTPNKKAFSGDVGLYEEILAACAVVGARCLNEATVGAGLPVVSTLKDLVATGDKVLKIEGVFSGTMSYIFNNFSTGSADGPSFSAVVKTACEKGYTEPHPGDDLNGADVARKLCILARHIPAIPRSLLPTGYLSVQTQSLVPAALADAPDGDAFLAGLPAHDAEFDKMRRDAADAGAVLRFVGVVDVEKREVRAELKQYPKTHPFATSLGGSDNIIMFHTERYGARPLIVQGAGAGAAVTAMGVMSDLLKLV